MTFRGALPAILTGISVVSAISAVIFAIHETPEAIKMLDDRRLEVDETGETDIDTKEKVKIYAKNYWPTAACLAVSAGTGIASCALSYHRFKGALITAAGISAAYAKHKDKVREVIGEGKAKFIDQQVNNEIKKEKECLKEDQLYWWMDSITGECWQMTMADFYDAKCEANKILALYPEGVRMGDIFPQLRKNNPIMAKAVWTKDYLITALDGYEWLDIDYHQINIPGSENKPIDWNINGGRQTRVIDWGLWPLTQKIAADCGYLSPAD